MRVLSRGLWLALLLLASAAQADTACRVDYQIRSDWGNGFTADVTLTNLGDAWSGWEVAWSMPDGQRITGLWNGSWQQSGTSVAVDSYAWNGNVATGSSVQFGFNGAYSGTNGKPWDIRVNGVPCEGQAPPVVVAPEPVACTVDYRVRHDWGSGATVDLVIRNDGGPVDGWEMAWTMPDGQRVTNAWSANYSQNGDAVTLSAASWNRALATGQEIQVGFNLAYGLLNRVPGDLALNGVTCDGQVPPPEPEPVACAVDYDVTADWGSGATISVRITNAGRPLSGWRVAWTMPAGQRVTERWSGTFSQQGDRVEVTPASWNGTLGSSATLEFGFNVSHAGFNPPPIDLSLDGVRCAGQPDEIVFPPIVPTGLGVAVSDNRLAILTWNAVPGEPEHLELQRRADGGAWAPLATLDGAATGYEDAAMQREVGYDYRLRSHNAAGNSGYSALVSAKLRDFSRISAATIADQCSLCHGVDGASGGPATPTIAGLDPVYFTETMLAFQVDGRASTIMGRVARGYTLEQIQGLAEHFAALPFVEGPQDTDPFLGLFGAELHDASGCWVCHGDAGEDGFARVRLAGQWRAYLENALLDYAEDLSPTVPPEMRDQIIEVRDRFGDEGLSALAHFYAGGRPDDGGGDDGGGDDGGGDDGAGPQVAPIAPGGLTARVLASGSVELAWSDRADNELGYLIERAVAGEAYVEQATLVANAGVFQDAAVALGGVYDYRVTAFNLVGASPSLTTTVVLPTVAELGAEQYRLQGCAACHGADGSGGFSGVPLNGYGDADLARLIALTAGSMPPQDPGSCTGLCAEATSRYLVDVLSRPDGGDAGGAIACADERPAVPRALRLLTASEYQATVNDLLGLAVDLTGRLPVENRVLGFDNNAEHNRVTATHIEIYLDLAEELSGLAMAANAEQLRGCDRSAGGCAELFVQTFGRRAFRRPLSEDEATRYLALFDGRGFDEAMSLTITSMLVSPSFLYRSELGEEQPDGSWRLSGYELASALSYLFHGSMPSDDLLASAERGDLDTKAGLITAAASLLEHPRARQRVGLFAGQWLLAGDPYQAPSKDSTLYPDFTGEIATAMADEIGRFFNHVAFDSSGKFEELLLADYVIANPALAGYYGLAAPATNDFGVVPVTDGSRLGLLTLGGVMTRFANADGSHPFKRGAFFLDRMLCQELPPVGNGGVPIPPPDPNLTTRERFDIHSNANQVCFDCHKYIDGPGFAFEGYDGAGRYRAVENGKPVDTSGVLRGLESFASAEELPFTNLAEMNEIVAASDNAAECLATQYYRFVTGRKETEADSCALDALKASYGENGYDIPTLLLGIVGSKSFTHRSGQ